MIKKNTMAAQQYKVMCNGIAQKYPNRIPKIRQKVNLIMVKLSNFIIKLRYKKILQDKKCFVNCFIAIGFVG